MSINTPKQVVEEGEWETAGACHRLEHRCCIPPIDTSIDNHRRIHILIGTAHCGDNEAMGMRLQKRKVGQSHACIWSAIAA